VKKLLLSLLPLLACSMLYAQDTPAPLAQPPASQNQNQDVTPMDQIPTFKVNVTGRTTKAVNYHYHSGGTKVDLTGTDLMPQAKGEARVEVHSGRIGIDASVKHLDSPQTFGREYLTYVLWAITPEGRADNLGEFLPGDNRKLSVTTDLQAFGLIVTAEPYFAVTEPSDVVVMENQIRPDTIGASEWIDAHYELIGRNAYIPPDSRSWAPPMIDPKLPPYLIQARNAVRIAQAENADRYATESFNKATALLTQAEDYQARRKPEAKPISTVAREAVQAAEDARVLTIRRIGDARLQAERKAAADRQAAAEQQASDEAARRQAAEQQAEDARRRSEQAQADADRAAKAQADAEAARQAALQQQQQAQANAQAAEQARLQADQARQQAEQARAQADQQRQQAERDKEELRARLLQQFNTILETRDTARGLVVNMSDVLFDTGKYTLRSPAREKLAKLSGIVLAYPGLKLAVEGHTDSVGSDAYNQRLSEQRATSVEKYLIQQGLSADALSAQGFGKSDPIADNSTAKGRQQNRRVEIVVSGEVIGTQIGTVSTQPATSTNPNPK
jgi:outer membrane protein OmpA-like peptidoglycan-associated protein